MKPVYSDLSLIITASLLLVHYLPMRTSAPPNLNQVAGIFEHLDNLPLNSESCFALGYKFELQSADLYDIELIPKISEKVATQILNRRQSILTAAAMVPKELQAQALADIPGVGKVTAKKLLNYFVLR